MKTIFLLIMSLMSTSAFAGAQTFCGWVDNPTPANIWMEDSFGSITISIQGGESASGDLNISNIYQYNGHYGAGCGCMKAELKVVNGERVATKILSSKELPLSACASDKNIKSSFRPVTLIHSSGKAYTECEADEQGISFKDGMFGEPEACVNEKNEYYYLAN